MSRANKALPSIRALEEMAAGQTFVHRRHPLCVLLVTLGYIITITSFDKYALSAILPLVIYPLYVLLIGEVSIRAIGMRALLALPFVLGVALFNPILDRQAAFQFAGVFVSYGWLSFLSILLRSMLCVCGALLLIATQGIHGVSASLRMLHVPRIFITQLLLTMRYIHVLAEEALRMSLAYRLRAPGQKGIAFKQWGSLAGGWLLRTLARAQRLYQAMLCRGYAGIMPGGKTARFHLVDALYLLVWCAFFALVRFIDLPELLGNIFLSLGG